MNRREQRIQPFQLPTTSNNFYDWYDWWRGENRMDVNWKDTASRALAAGVVGGAGDVLLGGSGSAALPLTNSPVPHPVAVGAGVGVASVVTDIAFSVAQKANFATQTWEKMVVGFGVSGGVSAYLNEPAGGTYTENFILGGLSYWAGDRINSAIYTSPGKLM